MRRERRTWPSPRPRRRAWPSARAPPRSVQRRGRQTFVARGDHLLPRLLSSVVVEGVGLVGTSPGFSRGNGCLTFFRCGTSARKRNGSLGGRSSFAAAIGALVSVDAPIVALRREVEVRDADADQVPPILHPQSRELPRRPQEGVRHAAGARTLPGVGDGTKHHDGAGQGDVILAGPVETARRAVDSESTSRLRMAHRWVVRSPLGRGVRPSSRDRRGRGRAAGASAAWSSLFPVFFRVPRRTGIREPAGASCQLCARAFGIQSSAS
jgi:hypothetical protein